MYPGFDGDLGEYRRIHPASLAVFAAGAAEILRGERGVAVALDRMDHRSEAVERRRPVGVGHPQRAPLHLFKSQGQYHVGDTVFDRLACQEQCRGAGSAIVVDVDHRYPAGPDSVERGLAGGRVPVHVADIGLLHRLVGHPGVGQGRAGGLLPITS